MPFKHLAWRLEDSPQYIVKTHFHDAYSRLNACSLYCSNSCAVTSKYIICQSSCDNIALETVLVLMVSLSVCCLLFCDKYSSNCWLFLVIRLWNNKLFFLVVDNFSWRISWDYKKSIFFKDTICDHLCYIFQYCLTKVIQLSSNTSWFHVFLYSWKWSHRSYSLTVYKVKCYKCEVIK